PGGMGAKPPPNPLKSPNTQLNNQQQEAVRAGTPVEVSDGSRVLYLISKEHYERLQGLLEAMRNDADLAERMKSAMSKNENGPGGMQPQVEQIDRSFYEATEVHLFDEQ
ncbi:MAG: type II toxin-antitoxin system prevent-host-death family antitoxin, partial [Pirellulales bacterium]